MSCPLAINKSSVKSLASWWLSAETAINYVGLTPEVGRGKVCIEMLSPGTFVGMPFVEAIYKEVGCEIEWHVVEGETIENCPFIVATITGSNDDLLFCESLVVSVLSRACGIASFANRLSKAVFSTAWKGSLCMPERRTPGFSLVEEYALMMAGVLDRKSSVRLRCCNLLQSGGVSEAIGNVRSKVGSAIILIECVNLEEATSAAKAGADIVALEGSNVKELISVSSQLKASYPEVQVQLGGCFSESDLKLCAISNVDFLTSLKLCNGYDFVNFQLTRLNTAGVVNSKSGSLTNQQKPVDTVIISPQGKSNSPGPLPTQEVDSSTPAPQKKLRLTEDQGDSPKPTKLNGTPIRNANPPSSSPNWFAVTNASNVQNQKRFQRNPRYPQPTPQQRLNLPRGPSPGNMQLIAMNNPRMMPPTPTNLRPPGMLPQPSLAVGAQLPGGLNPPNHNTLGMNLTMASQNLQQQRMPGNPLPVVSTNQPIGGGFLNNIPPHGTQQPNWQMIPGGGGPMVGGLGLGMRMCNPPHMNMSNCRSCGTPNNPTMPFCRNCRAPIR